MLVATGCTSGSEPKDTFTPTFQETYTPKAKPSSSPASPSVVPADAYQPATPTSPAKNVPKPKYPDAAKADTKDGQKAFVEYWFSTYNYAAETGDMQPLLDASTKDCEFCDVAKKDIHRMHQEEHLWRVGKGTTLDLSTFIFSSGPNYPRIVDVNFVDNDARFYTSPGKESRRHRASRSGGRARIWLDRTDGKFRVIEARHVIEK